MMAAPALQEEGTFCKKVKQYPVLFGKQLKGYREKDVYNQCMERSGKRNRNQEVFIILMQK